MSKCFIGWMVFACLDFFFFIPGGFLLVIVGYHWHSTVMMASGGIAIFVFFLLIPGVGLGLVVRKQIRDTNRFISMSNKSRRESSLNRVEFCGQQPTPTRADGRCVVSTSGNNFHDFSRRCSCSSCERQGLTSTEECGSQDHASYDTFDSTALPSATKSANAAETTTGHWWKDNILSGVFSQRSGYDQLV